MRTTISIDDAVLERAKAQARDKRQTLGEFVQEVLQGYFAGPRPARQPVRLPVFERGSGPAPGVDLTSNRGILDAAEDE